MTHRSFIAFASQDSLLADVITRTCESVSGTGVELVCWNMNDASGQPLGSTVYNWVENADSIVADISEPNHNVTYEVGLAIGMAKPLRLIRSQTKDWSKVQQIGLLHNIGHDSYSNQATLKSILQKGPPPTAPWRHSRKNREAPIYFLQPSTANEVNSRIASDIKKIVRKRFRSFNPREIDRLTASEAFTQVSASLGVIATWHNEGEPESFRQNQRAAFAIGLARGLGLPFLLLAQEGRHLPLDLDDIASRYAKTTDVDNHLRELKDGLEEFDEDFVEARELEDNLLESVSCGDPTAENEAATLYEYFLQTEQYRQAYRGELNVILGRKGSGKSAIFLQVRDNVRAKKENIVVDLAPENYQLLKLKEFVLEKLALGTRKEFISAFWEYIVLLEITYKILEKDQKRAKYDSSFQERYRRLQDAYNSRVDTGSGDFSERLGRLTDRIVERFGRSDSAEKSTLSSSKVLEIVYGAEIRTLRDEINAYLKIKGTVVFLFDNIDRFWSHAGFDVVDALIIVGLIEALQEVKKRFGRSKTDFEWVTFVRSDVFEFVVKGMADYGKVPVASVEWNDEQLLLSLLEHRVMAHFVGKSLSWQEIWNSVTVATVRGTPTPSFLAESSLMRPRYLIRLFETARRRAVTLRRPKIEEEDYLKAREELGWQVLEDVSHELSDIVPEAEDLLYDITALGPQTSLPHLRSVIQKKVAAEKVDAVIDVLIWSGCIGVVGPKGATYIADCGFRRPFIRSLMDQTVGMNTILLHPTLCSLIS